MSTEKIAFLYSLIKDKDGKKLPVLQYELQKVPVTMSITLKVSMVGLVQDEHYKISANVFSPEGENLTGTSDWLEFKANDSKETCEGIAVSLEAKFDGVEITKLGNYSMKATLKRGDTELDCATCYFNMRRS
ncbi:hypothetical protein [Klebsiella sp. 2680]|uniref:hypothetical protein n=1 Tax=Klebsiella sp. 2680 TaxID=2018037 RepID=UPI001157C02B|nr:hypothetical protein [Klebsiella sp. 2680]